MKRYVDLKEISDGRLYDVNDMAKLGCNGCEGCSLCCHGMKDTIVLDPLDVYRLTGRLQQSFEELLSGPLALRVVDGIILPYLRMSEEDACVFLNAEGWCSIHQERPGLCRLFPLGRYYENHDFRFFLQVGECYRENRTKVKISKWIDTPDYARNKEYILTWHYFLNDVEELILQSQDEQSQGETADKTINMTLLNLFFVHPYEHDRGFYEQFEERLAQAKRVLGMS